MDDAQEGWDEDKWDARTRIELSMAIKCPSIDLHLCTMKKFQQHLCDHEKLEYTLGPTFKDLDLLKQLFTGCYSMEDYGKEGAAINDLVEEAIKNPHDYVLKPLKEGGGNNFFDSELKENLVSFKEDQDSIIKSYILMERIDAPMVEAVFVKEAKLSVNAALSELGIFSLFIYDTSLNRMEYHSPLDRFKCHTVFGQVLRSKLSHFNEGGIAAGYAHVDDTLLVPDEVFFPKDAPLPKVVPSLIRLEKP